MKKIIIINLSIFFILLCSITTLHSSDRLCVLDGSSYGFVYKKDFRIAIYLCISGNFETFITVVNKLKENNQASMFWKDEVVYLTGQSCIYVEKYPMPILKIRRWNENQTYWVLKNMIK